MAKYYTLVLNLGYVESTALAWIPFTSKIKFKTAKEALMDLAKFFEEKFTEKYLSNKPKECCIAQLKDKPKSKFCDNCGKNLAAVTRSSTVDCEDFMEFIENVCNSNVNDVNELIDWHNDDCRWESTGFDTKNIRYVVNADRVLATILGHYTHPNVTKDDIFSNYENNTFCW